VTVAVPLLVRESRWECPNCDQTAVTRDPRPHSRFHECPGIGLLSVPMVPAGTRCKVVAHDRDDYVGRDLVQTIPETGRPVMAVTVTRDDGEDRSVYAPCATATAGR
jgi:hypothetical protein